MEARFEERNQLWLNTRITLQTEEACATSIYQGPSTSNIGRPVKSLGDCSEVTKRRKLREHNQNISTDLINQGLCQRYKSERQHEKASIVEAVEEVGPDLLNEMKNTIRTAKNAPRKFTAEEALSLFLDLGLSKDKYTVLRNELKKRNHDALPSYNKIIQARNKCLPEIDEVTSDSAKVPLQKLLDSTVNGILQLKTEGEIEALSDTNLLLTSKWGYDGSSGQNEYKQKLSDNVNSIVTDSNMFMVSMVPLRLQCTDTDSLLWKNPRPSSAHFCRTIKFQYLKETKELIKTEVECMRNKINSLAPTKCVVHGREVSVFHKLHLSMLDGKVAQYLTDTISSSTCIICQKNSKDFGTASEEDVQKNYEYSLSPLHARIRLMEFVLHIGYDLSFKGEGIRNIPENEQKRQEAKLKVQTKFRNKLGLIIDTPKQELGSSNDGNAARRFFEYPCITSAITGIDVGILQRFKTILNVLSCGASVDADKFGICAAETEQLITEKYPWRRLTATMIL